MVKGTEGVHLIVDGHYADSDKLKDPVFVLEVLTECANRAKATTTSSHWHEFTEGGGISATVLLMESHVSIHTWPEHGFFSFDLYTCGKTCNPRLCLEFLEYAFGIDSVLKIKVIERGKQEW